MLKSLQHAKEMDDIDKEIQSSNAVIAGFKDTAGQSRGRA